jgi:YD repeat-containing protein
MKSNTILIVCVLLLTACKSKHTSAPQSHRLKTAIYSNGEALSYEYDADGRTTNISSTKKGRREFGYAKGTATETHYNMQGEGTSITEYRLNGDGLVSNESMIKPAGGKEKIYLYNANGFITAETAKEGENRETSVYYYTGDQLDSMLKRSNENKLLHKQLYTYYTDIKNTAFTYNESISIKGKQSPLAVKKLDWIFYDNDGKEQTRQTLDYKYETDASGRVIRVKVNSAESEIASIAYTYY